MKLWQKTNTKRTLQQIENFTIGKDQVLDILLAKYDLLGNMAHGVMLETVGLLERHELILLLRELKDIYKNLINHEIFEIETGIEDVHSQVELLLTRSLGEIGKKIHSGRSRNDQVLVDLKLFFREELKSIVESTASLSMLFLNKSDLHKRDYLPGYTHMQIAMPSSFGLWFGAYAESLIDDLRVIQGIYAIINKNPLGSGAGYGSSFPLNRTLTTSLLGFNEMDYNVVYAQMTRGKSELLFANAIALVSQTLSRYAMDVCMYNSQNFNFITLPEEFTTGSSIMPHKKNPDVAELLRGKFNLLKVLPTQVQSLLNNLPSGYHREYQLLKEVLFPAIQDLKNCLDICYLLTENIAVKKDILKDSKYDLLFSVENVSEAVKKGTPFREAYKEIGDTINNGTYTPNRELNHTLEGSLGNLDNSILRNRLQEILDTYTFEQVNNAIDKLLNFDVEN